MTEEQAKYGVTIPDAGELMMVPNVTFRQNALIFKRVLAEEDYRMICSGLTKFSEGRQWFWSDFWRELALRGYEWVEYIPDSIDLGTAQTWYKVGAKFLPDDRVYGRLLFSHYAATRALPDVEAHKILEAANEGGWTEKAVREATKLLLGNPPKTPKPKVVQCAHCDHWIAETTAGCSWCILSVAQKRIEQLREFIQDVRDREDMSSTLRELCEYTLAEV